MPKVKLKKNQKNPFAKKKEGPEEGQPNPFESDKQKKAKKKGKPKKR